MSPHHYPRDSVPTYVGFTYVHPTYVESTKIEFVHYHPELSTPNKFEKNKLKVTLGHWVDDRVLAPLISRLILGGGADGASTVQQVNISLKLIS